MSLDRDLPTGTVTFVCTDIEGSTALLKELEADAYADVLEKHRVLLREVFAEHRGVEVDTQGDAFLVAFARATDAVSAASEAQKRLTEGPLRVRMGLHTGEPVRTSEGYAGLVVHTAARICAVGHGAQVLLSQATRDLAEVEAKDLGAHLLKDLDAPVRLYQLGHAEFPPPKSRFFSNLPVPATPFLGREHEVEEVVDLLRRDDARLVTLVGPGGTGKTRLAIEAAAGAPEPFPDGITWIPLAPLDDPTLLLPTVAHSVGISDTAETSLPETLTNALASRRTLLLLDNMEHLLPHAAADVALLAEAGAPVVLATSRERLQLQGERVYSVPPLTEGDAVEFFRVRADALGTEVGADGVVDEICARLDRLPLALELAAARMTLFTPEQLLERLGQRLDLLKGGRDADARQRTLRATIEWSYHLLDEEEQRLFRQLSIFAGGCTFEAAEEVCEATPDTLQSLIDKSLLRRRQGQFGPRYWMLETIREYAAEQLEGGGDADAVALRHAYWTCELAERLVGMPPRRLLDEGFGSFSEEYDGVRNAISWAWTSGEHELGLRFGPACVRYWMSEALFHDARAWLEQATPKASHAPPPIRREALRAAGVIAFFVLGDAALADEHWSEALAVAEEIGDEEEIAWIQRLRVGVLWERGDFDRALALHEENLQKARASGNRLREADILHLYGEVIRDLGRFDEAETYLLDAEAIYEDIGSGLGLANNVHSRADLSLDRGDLTEAVKLYQKTIDLYRVQGWTDRRNLVYCLSGIASVLAEQGEDDEAATLWGAACAAEDTLGFRMLGTERRRYETRLRRLESSPAWLAGRALTLDEAEERGALAVKAAGL
jgi:predicted ATPase/class 3 adenylate cyclase